MLSEKKNVGDAQALTICLNKVRPNGAGGGFRLALRGTIFVELTKIALMFNISSRKTVYIKVSTQTMR